MVPVDSKVVQLNPKLLVPHPDNPRGRLEEKDVAELLPLIEQHGQQQPCVVRDHPSDQDKFQVIIGHRRSLVGRLLDRPVPSLVVPMTDDQALAVMLADNPSHVAPDPLRESEAVATFLSRPNMTLQAVADLLGKTPRWVAQRANLQHLAPGVRKKLQGKTHGDADLDRLKLWPVSWLERLAALRPEAQEQIVTQRFIETEHDLADAIAEHTRQLGNAPWDLEDAVLVPAAGSCAECPKQSGHCPGLFDDGTQALPLKKSLCMDSVCWKGKLEAHGGAFVKKLREKHPGLVAVHGEYSGDREELPHPGITKPQGWRVIKAKNTEKGALPALVVSGKGRGEVVFVKLKKTEQPAKAKAAMQEVLNRRAEWIEKEFLVRLQKHKAPLHSPAGKTSVLALAAIIGTRLEFHKPNTGLQMLAAAAAGKKSVDELWGLLWQGFLDYMNDDRGYALQDVAGDQGVKLVAQLVGFDLEGLEEEAKKKIPDPKVVKELPPAKGKKETKASGKKKAHAAAAV
jgi:ParB/RepB/Spo0J family partition protein